MQAHLFAPSRAVGFVQAGHAVRLRYPAFPYQKFGHQAGEVASVSKVALSGPEVAAISGGGAAASNTNEPLYRIVVRLSGQDIEGTRLMPDPAHFFRMVEVNGPANTDTHLDYFGPLTPCSRCRHPNRARAYRTRPTN